MLKSSLDMARLNRIANTPQVLYTKELEPITIFKMSPWLAEHITRHWSVSIAVTEPPIYTVSRAMDSMSPMAYKIIRVDLETLCYSRGRERELFTTHDEEAAMLLKSVFLPGQLSDLQDERRKAFARGFLEGLLREHD